MTFTNSLEAAGEATLTLLTRQVRVATSSQLQRYYTTLGFTESPVMRVLRKSERLGLLACSSLCLALPTWEGPLFSWSVGDGHPVFGPLAWLLNKRYAQAPARIIQVFHATERGAEITGGTGGPIRQPDQVEHDLGTTAIFVHHHAQSTAATDDWVSEDLLRRDYQHLFPRKVPDAALISNNRIMRVFETGGQYSVKRLKAFHRYFAERKVPYEIW
jgi:hypothetical protein